MELSLSTPKNRPSTYCTSLSLSAQIKCTPITTKKRRGRWERQRADSTCSSQRWFSLSAKKSFSLTRLGEVSWPQSYCISEQSHQGHQFLLLWPPPPYNLPAQVSRRNKDPTHPVRLLSWTAQTPHVMPALTHHCLLLSSEPRQAPFFNITWF